MSSNADAPRVAHPPASARLDFRCWRQTDSPLAESLWMDPHVMQHMGGPMTQAECRDRLQLEMLRQQTFGFQYWPMFLLETSDPAGCAGLRPFHDAADVLEFGVHVHRRFWSARLGEEAARTVISHAFDVVGVSAVVGGTSPNNLNSQAMLGRLGFQFTHTEPWGKHGTLHPYYRLESRAWSRKAHANSASSRSAPGSARI